MQWKRNYCTCSIKTRDTESQCWDAAMASGDQQRKAGVLGWIETCLLISFFSLTVSWAAEARWTHGGRVMERRRAERRPSAGQDNAGFLLPSMKALRGMTLTTLVSLPLDCSLPGRCACHTDATACPCWPTKLLEQMMGSQQAGHDWGVPGAAAAQWDPMKATRSILALMHCGQEQTELGWCNTILLPSLPVPQQQRNQNIYVYKLGLIRIFVQFNLMLQVRLWTGQLSPFFPLVFLNSLCWFTFFLEHTKSYFKRTENPKGLWVCWNNCLPQVLENTRQQSTWAM